MNNKPIEEMLGEDDTNKEVKKAEGMVAAEGVKFQQYDEFGLPIGSELR